MMDLEKMAQLWNERGWSMSEIGAEFGFTRNKVSGIIRDNRELFKSRRDCGCKPIEERRTKPRNSTEKAQEWQQAKATTKDRAIPKRAPAVVYEPISKAEAEAYDLSRIPYAKDLIEIGPCECRWWVSEGPIMFCAEVTVGASSWCEHHKRRLVGRGTESERKAASDLRRAA